MVSIDALICQNTNPFDDTDLIAGHFWIEQKDKSTEIDSIHLEEINKIESYLNLVAQDHYSRSLLLLGDSGSGKSYLLGRLKRKFNSKAFFVYIDPWVDSRHLWRHILRRTVDSLLHIPENNQDSQLILWLKSLSIVREGNFFQRLFNTDERQRFLTKLKNIYPHGIANAREFFGVLYDLLNPDLSDLACDWLKGDNLKEEDLQSLKVSHSIDSEDSARAILENLGRISIETHPIILCFDQLDNIPLSLSGFIDLQSLFNFNSNIHTQMVRNFLIIITMPTSTWQDNQGRIQPSDLAIGRLHNTITLKQINRQQIEALWQLKLSAIHSQASPQHFSALHPLTDEAIKINFPSGKALPRTALVVGKNLYQTYKDGICISDPKPDLLELFKTYWSEEFQKVQTRIVNIKLLLVTELMKMLVEVLHTLKLQDIKPTVSPNNKDSCYINFTQNKKKICLVWSEDPNLKNFYNVMKFCEKAITNQACNQLYLLRNATIGNSENEGYKIHRQNFGRSPHRHLEPTLTSIHYLATYHQLVIEAKARNLVIAGQTIDLPKLADLMRQAKILDNCVLLQDLGLVSNVSNNLNSPQTAELSN